MDEEVDEMTLDGLERKDREQLYRLPRERLFGGTSEILNWVAMAGAMEDRAMTLVDYVPCYRSLAATGCGAGFAYWA
jgi:3-O-methylgallate 3,4-dioxygenase